MKLYQPGLDPDLLLLNWYFDMAKCDDLERAFSVTLAPCAAFMAEMSKSLLIYEADERGFWFCMWFDRLLSGGSFGVWVREDKRHGHLDGTWDVFHAALEGLKFGLEKFPVLVFVTRNPDVLGMAQRLGFQPLGTIPAIFDGESAMIAWLDGPRFAAVAAQHGLEFTDPFAALRES